MVKHFIAILAIAALANTRAVRAEDTAPATNATASLSFDPTIEGKACTDDFISKMNDPSSFQLAGSFAMDPMFTRVFNTNKEMKHGFPSIVIYSVPIRGRNAYGGLVLKTLRCLYGEKVGERLSFIQWLDPQ